MLTLALVPVLESFLLNSLPPESLALVENLIEDHGLSGPSPPEWMMELFDDIVAGRTARIPRFVSSAYPRGENGLANLLADIHRELLPLGIDDFGEGVVWPIPGFGVRVMIDRELDANNAKIWLEKMDKESPIPEIR